jgi:hypothetical protein
MGKSKTIKEQKYAKHDINKLKSCKAEIKKSGLGKIATICKKYNILRNTVKYRIKKDTDPTASGSNSILSASEENLIVQWIKISVNKGFPIVKDQMLDAVQGFLTTNPRKNPFKDNRPGCTWYRLFLKRHPEVTIRKPEFFTAASGNVFIKTIENWFKHIELYLKENSYF